MRHHVRRGRRDILGIERQEVAHHEVGPAVQIVIPEGDPDTPLGKSVQLFGAAQAKGVGDIGKGPVAVVAVEDVRTVVQQVDVHVAVPIVVERTRSHAPMPVVHTGLSGLFGERPVPVVAVQFVRRVGEGASGGIADALEVRPVQQVQVEIAVAVVVEHGDTRATALEDVLIGRIAERVAEVNPGSFGDIGEANRR